MTKKQAIKLALACIRYRMRYLSPLANLEDRYHAGIPSAANASAERAKLWAAADKLKEMMK